MRGKYLSCARPCDAAGMEYAVYVAVPTGEDAAPIARGVLGAAGLKADGQARVSLAG
jgi:hypothetical protein